VSWYPSTRTRSSQDGSGPIRSTHVNLGSTWRYIIFVGWPLYSLAKSDQRCLLNKRLGGTRAALDVVLLEGLNSQLFYPYPENLPTSPADIHGSNISVSPFYISALHLPRTTSSTPKTRAWNNNTQHSTKPHNQRNCNNQGLYITTLVITSHHKFVIRIFWTFYFYLRMWLVKFHVNMAQSLKMVLCDRDLSGF
jgi:hypothetical protein